MLRRQRGQRGRLHALQVDVEVSVPAKAAELARVRSLLAALAGTPAPQSAFVSTFRSMVHLTDGAAAALLPPGLCISLPEIETPDGCAYAVAWV